MSALKFQVLTRLASEKRAGSACIVLDLGKCSSSDKIQQFQKDITSHSKRCSRPFKMLATFYCVLTKLQALC